MPKRFFGLRTTKYCSCPCGEFEGDGGLFGHVKADTMDDDRSVEKMSNERRIRERGKIIIYLMKELTMI